jgi:hypothetical protein
MKVIFYGNRQGNALDKLIRWYTSPFRWKFNGKWKDTFSHVELVFNNGTMFSASQYENQVRIKPYHGAGKAWIEYHLPLSVSEEKILSQRAKKLLGKSYDYRGVLGFIFGNKDLQDSWFCSEVCVYLLHHVGLCRDLTPSKTSPNDLGAYLGLLRFTND